MLRPFFVVRCKIASAKPRDIVRMKMIYPTSLVKRADRIKQWHRENKELFGPLLENTTQKKQRMTQKTAKNSKQTRPHNSVSALSEETVSCDKNVGQNSAIVQALLCRSALKSSLASVSSVSNSLQTYRRTMWSNTRNCVNFVGAILNANTARGLKTVANKNAAQSSSATNVGFASEDKILQIRQHKNDFSQDYPSVTLILNKTMTEDSKTALEKWKQERIAEMGADQFNKFYEAQMAVGTKFHNTLKRYFTQPQNKLTIEKDVEGVWTSVGDVLKTISTPKAIESNVIHPVLKYRGIFDAIAEYEDKPTLIEWKKSDKPRKAISLTYDNPVQLAAYFGAVSNDLNYKHLNVRDALLVIAYTDGSKADVFHLSMDKLREHWAQWLSRLEIYMRNYGTDTEKILKGGKRLFEEDIGNLQ